MGNEDRGLGNNDQEGAGYLDAFGEVMVTVEVSEKEARRVDCGLPCATLKNESFGDTSGDSEEANGLKALITMGSAALVRMVPV